MQVTNSNTAAEQIVADANKSSASTTLPVDKLANKETFLQLLVAQIKNQDPLQPTDGIQFVSQLAQFSQLEQLIAIRDNLAPKTPAEGDQTGTDATTN